MNKSKIDPVLIPGIPFREVASVTPGGGAPSELVTTRDISEADREEFLRAIRAAGDGVVFIDEAHVVTVEEG